MKHDTGTKTAGAETPIAEALERAADPVFDRHPSATGSVDQALAGPGQALPLDPLAEARDREDARQAITGLTRLVSGIVCKRFEAAARNIGGQEFAAEIADSTAVADEEADSFGDLSAQIAQKYKVVKYLKFLPEVAWSSLVIGIGSRWSSAMKRLATMHKEKLALKN